MPRNPEQIRKYWREYSAHLDSRIPYLHRHGYPGRLARIEAEREWTTRKGK